MPRRIWQDGMEVIQDDLSSISASLEKELYDRIIYELMGRQQNLAFGDSFVASFINNTTVQIKAGNGVYFDNTQVDPEPQTRLLYLAANTNKSIAAADATNNRIDIISIAPSRSVIQTVTRNFKDAITGAITAVNQNVETDWTSILTVTTGTPSVSPAVPSTPAGNIVLCQVLVTAVSGVANQAAITDKRVRYRRSGVTQQSKSAAYTIDLDDNQIFANAAGGAFATTLPLAADAIGRSYEIFNTGSSNNVTLTCAGSDTFANINGTPTTTAINPGSAVRVISNGSAWYLA